MNPTPIDTWHQILTTQDPNELDGLLADDVVFHSPVVHTPQRGKAITKRYLAAAFRVLFNDSFEYVREVIGQQDAVLEFMVDIDGISVNGVDMISWDRAGKITDFKVMIRPLKAIGVVQSLMARELANLDQSQ